MLVLNSNGVLDVGIHDATVDEIGETFGKFQKTSKRQSLFSELKKLVEQLQSHEFVKHILVDGSFVTSKDVPGDIDLIIGVSKDIFDRLEIEDIKPIEYNVVSARRLRKRYPFDVYVSPIGSESYESYLKFFANLKGAEEKKGLVRIKLR